MANEVLVGLKIGAVVSGSLHAAFGSAKSTVQQLVRATDGLTTKQKLMGTELAASIARGGTGVERLRRQYDQVGRTIEQLKTKQERLNTSIARGETLKNKRADLRGQAMETIGTAAVIGAPIVQSMRTAIDFQDQLRDISITANFDSASEVELGKLIRGTSLKSNQTQKDVGAGVGELVAGGLGSLEELRDYAPVMAEVATATRASMTELAASTIALRSNMKITTEDYKGVMNMLAAGGKAGQFELKDMAKWLPEMASMYGSMGQTGKKSVAELTAALQVARMGAGSSDEAANNYKNFISKLNSPDTIKSFKDAGIDLKASMRDMAENGLSPVKSMLNILSNYLGEKGPEAATKYRKALDLKDDQERQMALERLDEGYKLGALFRDQQVLAFIRPALANKDKLASIEAEASAAADQDVIGEDFKKRIEGASEQLKSLRINLSEIGISVGSILTPTLVDVTRAIIPVMHSFATWAGENPSVIKGVVGLVGGLLAGKLAFIGLAYGANLVMSPFVAMSTTITTVSTKWTLLRGMWQMGKFAPLVKGLTRIGGGFLTVARYSGLFLRGVTMALGAPLLMVARGGLFLGKILGGTLLYGLQLAGQAVLWLGRALLMNPIGLLITGIALSAYLIYRYWEPIKGFFSGLWAEVKAGFNGGLFGITGLILNFSPLGLFYRAFAGVMSYFGVELPGKFSEFGGMLVQGLVSGISNMAGSLKDSVVGIGSSVKGWFTETLGIQSPSRVFMGYGANISEGAALGITTQSDLVRKAALGMAAQSKVDLAAPNHAAPNPADVSRASMMGGFGGGPGAAPGAGAGPTFHFSPQINVPGGHDVREQVGHALQAGYPDFVKMLERYFHDKRRLSYGSPGEGFA